MNWWREEAIALAAVASLNLVPLPDWGVSLQIPYCPAERCPCYNGSECRLTGLRAGPVCTPVVASMARLLG